MSPQITQIAKLGSGHEKSNKRASPMLCAWLMEPRHADVWSPERANSPTNRKHDQNASRVPKL
ncbi:hypothetical protein LB503_007921 [Fusarium chuoi]|nr:hypothetical protein LB503_007921 [Fusarium chuoi]